MAGKTSRNLKVSLFLLIVALVSSGEAAFLYREILGLREEFGGSTGALSAAVESLRREAVEREERLVQSLTSFTCSTDDRFIELLQNQKELAAGLAVLPGSSSGPPEPAPEEDYPLFRQRDGLAELYRDRAYTECIAAAGEFLAVYPLDAEARFYRGASRLRLNPADGEALLAARRDLQLAREQLPDDSRISPLLAEIALEEGVRRSVDEP